MKEFSKDLGNVSLAPKGKWSREQEYERLALVYNACDNLSYVAKINVPSGVDIENREYWQPMNATGYADNNFINLTTKNENGTITAYETLEEAVATILPINRRAGATLSFYNLNSDRLDRQAEFELWQFNSTDLANWENKDYWNNVYYNWNVFVGWYIGADALKNHVKIPTVGQYAYVGSNLNDALLYQCRTNGTWTNTGTKVRNYISVVVSGNITIGDNGNWFSDGKDTGIPATPAVDEQLDNIGLQLQQHNTEIDKLQKQDVILKSNIDSNFETINNKVDTNTTNLQKQITGNDNDIATLNKKHESLSKIVQGIAATGGASTTNVTYDKTNSGLNAENAQDAIDELQDSKIDKTSIVKEFGDSEELVMSQKAVSDKFSNLSERDIRGQLINGVSTKDINGENIETFVHSSGLLQKVNGYAGKKFAVQPNKRYYINSTVKDNPEVRIFALYLNDKFIVNGPLTTESSTCILDTHEINCNTLYVSSTEDKLSEVYIEEFTTNATTNEDDINTINKVAENKNVIDGYVQKELNFCDSYNDCIINTNGYKVSAEGFVVLKYDIRTASNLIIKNDINNEYCLLWSIFGNNILIQKGSNSKGNIIDYITPKGEYLLTCCQIKDVNKVHVYNICPTSLIESDISFLVSNETQKGSFIDPTSGKVSKNADFLVKSYHIFQQYGTIKIPFSYEKASYLGYSFSNENDIIEYGDTNRNEFKIPTGATSFSMSYRGEKRNTILQFYERNVSSVTKLKDSNYRRKIEINLTDSEEEIADKLFFAFYLGNCDVFWEHGTYSFNNVFEYIHNKYNGSNNNELPLGGNCRYYFNDSTIIGNKQSTDENIMNNESLFGVLRQSTSFEINDATFVANGLIYVVHDDAGGNQRHYLHKYNNIKMQYISKDFTNDIRKCVGGGMGKDGHVIFNNCYFETDHQFAITWHGNSTNSDDSKIKIEIINSILKNAIGFETLPENNTGELELKFNYINDSGYINDSWKVLDIGNIKK